MDTPPEIQQQIHCLVKRESTKTMTDTSNSGDSRRDGNNNINRNQSYNKWDMDRINEWIQYFSNEKPSLE
jgi:hypothetical protein